MCSQLGCQQKHTAVNHVQSKKHVNLAASRSLSSCLTAWREELGNDPDREFILHSLSNGFDIIDSDAIPSAVHCQNHPSARPGSPLYEKAFEQVQKEIYMGHYEVLSVPPTIISPMG